MKKSNNISIFTALILLFGFVLNFLSQPVKSEGYLRVAFLDVGQGDATLITTPNNKNILIDGSESYEKLSKAFKMFFIKNGSVMLVVATHNHIDHIGGLVQFIDKYEPKEIWFSGAIHTSGIYIAFLEALKNAKDKGSMIKTVKSGQKTIIDDTKLEVLYPIKNYTQTKPTHQHDANLVVALSYGSTRFLFTGDLEQKNEDELIETFYSDISANVLKVSHHGSKYSTSSEFIKISSPEIAVISAGRDNRYGHPNPETINRISNEGIKIFRTDELGTIIVKTDGEKIWVE